MTIVSAIFGHITSKIFIDFYLKRINSASGIANQRRYIGYPVMFPPKKV